MKSLTINSLIIFCSVIFAAAPQAVAEMPEDSDTRIEKYEELSETDADTTSNVETPAAELDVEKPDTRAEETLEEYQSKDTDSSYDIRKTEAFNLVSSAYRGDFEEQGINSYSVLVSNYEAGELTAEDIIEAAIESGDLSPSAMEDDSYVNAVDSHLSALAEG